MSKPPQKLSGHLKYSEFLNYRSGFELATVRWVVVFILWYAIIVFISHLLSLLTNCSSLITILVYMNCLLLIYKWSHSYIYTELHLPETEGFYTVSASSTLYSIFRMSFLYFSFHSSYVPIYKRFLPLFAVNML